MPGGGGAPRPFLRAGGFRAPGCKHTLPLERGGRAGWRTSGRQGALSLRPALQAEVRSRRHSAVPATEGGPGLERGLDATVGVRRAAPRPGPAHPVPRGPPGRT